jgi:hypothetical protein
VSATTVCRQMITHGKGLTTPQKGGLPFINRIG